MKKENGFKKILIKAFIGFPVGVTLLIIAYISTYFISNADAFDFELYQLHNINTLIYQTISSGISGYLSFIVFFTYLYLQNKEYENKLTTEYTSQSFLIIMIFLILVFIIIFKLLENPKIFSENISIISITIFTIFYGLNLLIFCIKGFIESHLIREINEKIKARNK